MIVVTGGAGFIGSNLVAHLSAGADVVVCDRLRSNDKWRNLTTVAPADFVYPEQLFDALAHYRTAITSVIHMGAVSATTVTDGDLVVQSNFQLSRDLWRWCSEQEVPLIYASSAATYGDGTKGFVDEAAEEHLAKLKPLNLYGWSKHWFDRWAVAQARRGLCPPSWAGLKFFNVYGPGEAHKGSMKSVVAHLFPKVAAGEPARLFKSYHPDYPHGGQRRDFVYVKDCVAVVEWLLTQRATAGLFNVGTGRARTFEDLAKALMRALNVEPRIEYIDMPEALRDKYQYFTEASLDNLRAVGYCAPFTDLETGVADYVHGHLMSVTHRP
ncbi:MAG: ADP-glyceromanno-heptose 6-epimerase [Candidatus Competibacterales bacterium]